MDQVLEEEIFEKFFRQKLAGLTAHTTMGTDAKGQMFGFFNIPKNIKFFFILHLPWKILY